MSTVTMDDLAAVLPTMDRRQVQILARSVLGLRTADQQKAVSLFDQLKAGLWEFMLAVGFVTDAQRLKVLELAAPTLRKAADVYPAGGTHLPVVHIVFAEQRWVACPLIPQWYDMVFDEHVEALPEPAVLLVTCDVTAMYLRQRAWLSKLGSGKDAGPEHHVDGNAAVTAQPDGAGPEAA